MSNRISLAALVGMTALFVGCGDAEPDPFPVDSGSVTLADAGLSDSSSSVVIPGPEASTPVVDSSVSVPQLDATTPRLDGGSGTPDATTGGGADAGAPPGPGNGKVPTKLPTATGTCPEFTSGDHMFAGRNVKLWVGAQGGGPIVFYWHGTGSRPAEAETGLRGVLPMITGQGGVVAALYPGPNEGTFPWLMTMADALKVVDEVLACAIMKKQINPSRIHAAGMSAGGLASAAMGLARANYVASISAYSGGASGIPQANQDTTNKYAALLFHGGTGDTVAGLNFKTASENYSNTIKRNGSFTVLCDHGRGHTIPSDGPAASWKFFQDHTFGVTPSPYAGKPLPSPVPSYCKEAM